LDQRASLWCWSPSLQPAKRSITLHTKEDATNGERFTGRVCSGAVVATAIV
jgi:hypothetical protein